MPAGGVDWLPTVLFLGLGLAAGGVIVWRILKARAAGPRPLAALPLETRDASARLEARLQELRELDDTATKRNPEQLAHERYRLELEAAQAWRELDRSAVHAAAPEPPAARPAGVLEESPALLGFFWGTGAMSALGILLYLLVSAAQPRDPAGPVTGGMPGARDPATPAADPEEKRLLAALERDPGSSDARIELARHYLFREDMMNVFEQTRLVLEREPGHARALTYQSLVRSAMGQTDVAIDMLRRAIQTDPRLVEAHAHLAVLYARSGRAQEAAAEADAARKLAPDQGAALDRMLASVAGSPAEAPSTDPHAGVAPPPASSVQPASEASGSESPTASVGRMISGTIDLDPNLRGRLAAGGVLFLMVREAGTSSGPPTAVKRLSTASFPVSFEIGSADSMAGEELPASMRIDARLDADGNAMTRAPEDPIASLEAVKPGADSLRLVLKRP